MSSVWAGPKKKKTHSDFWADHGSLEPCNFHSVSHFEECVFSIANSKFFFGGGELHGTRFCQIWLFETKKKVQIFNQLSVFFDNTMETTVSFPPSQFATENLQNHLFYKCFIF